MNVKMKVRDFIKMDVDIDVYDDVCEELAIAFCGPAELTDAGKEHFADVLDYEVVIYEDVCEAVVCVDDGTLKGWKKRLRKANEFFYSIAGFCSETDYERWFKE